MPTILRVTKTRGVNMKFIDVVKRHIGPPVKIDLIVRDLGIDIDMEADFDT